MNRSVYLLHFKPCYVSKYIFKKLCYFIDFFLLSWSSKILRDLMSELSNMFPEGGPAGVGHGSSLQFVSDGLSLI
jgi:hypothetical protein